jgi:ElaB/YqjD/DUF883 family membrane-anchored ribosome-binding protein
MTASSEDPTTNFATDLAALRQDVARLPETMGDLVRHQTRATGHRVSEATQGAMEKFAGAEADALDPVCGAGGALEASIGRNPWRTVLISLAAGMSLGLLSRWHGRATLAPASQPTKEQ